MSTVTAAFPRGWAPSDVHDFMTTHHKALRVANERLSPAEWILVGLPPERVLGLLDGASGAS